MSADKRPTPETWRAIAKPRHFREDQDVVSADIAASLERRLDEMSKAYQRAVSEYTQAQEISLQRKDELAALRSEKERLRQALQELVDLKEIHDSAREGSAHEYYQRKPAAWSAARAALAGEGKQ